MKPKIRFYTTVNKRLTATVTIGEVKIYLDDIEWDNPRELWFIMACPMLDVNPRAQVISVKRKILQYTWFKNYDVEMSCNGKISKETYKEIIKKVFTSEQFINNYMNALIEKICGIDFKVSDVENKIDMLQEKNSKIKRYTIKIKQFTD